MLKKQPRLAIIGLFGALHVALDLTGAEAASADGVRPRRSKLILNLDFQEVRSPDAASVVV